MADGHKRKRTRSQDDLDYEQSRASRQSLLQTKIVQLIERHKIQHQVPGLSTSQSLMNGFIRHIWPEIRDDYRQMTQYLGEELKTALKERHIDAEISSRVKEDASIAQTLERRQKGLFEQGRSGFNSYHDIFYEMHDLSGLRIVLMNREHHGKAQKLIKELFTKQKSSAHFDPNREVGQFWRRPWFGAYETHNHRVQLANDSRADIGAGNHYCGVMFEIQLTTFSDNLYNKLAHDLLYKADPGLVTSQEEMVIDVSHGLARCFELCMRILRPKLHRDTETETAVTAEDLHDHTEKELQLAQSAVDDFEKDLHNHSESDRIAQQLRKLLSKKEDAEDQACLKDLLGSDPRVDKTRIEETKGGLLPSSYNWIFGDHDFQQWREDGQSQPFWITGAPGKGKTMMLCGIINGLREESNTNVSYFFCQGTDKRINTGTAVLRGILFLLCKQQHSLISHIRDKYDDAGKTLFEDTNAWFSLSEIFNSLLGDSALRHTYLIVDALDECLQDSRQLLAKLIVRMSNAHPHVKWIVSSRELEDFNAHLKKTTHLSLESRGESVSATVDAYIQFKVTEMGEQELSHPVVEQIASELKRKSGGTFLWVALVCKELKSAPEFDVMDVLQEMPTGLNDLYGKLVQDIKALKRRYPTYCQSVLQAVAVAFRPLTLEELQGLAGLPQNVPVDAIAEMCKSFLAIRDNTAFFVHQSAKDYLWNEWGTVFQPSIRDTHESMFLRSIEAMKQVLCQDMYSLEHPGISIENIQRPSPDPLVSIRYSCVYWVAHFSEAQPCSAEDAVDGFLRHHFLYWLEALSLTRSASEGVYALRDLVTLSNKGHQLEPLFSLASDMYRFAQSYGAIIEEAPLQAYSSALIFSPTRSLTRQLFTSNIPDWIVQKPRVEQNWNSRLATLMGHLDPVTSVAFSSDGHRIVSGSLDCNVKMWDAGSGAQVLTFRGHEHPIWSVAFKRKDKFITSKSIDNTVKTWDAETGACIATSEHSQQLTGKVFLSPNKRHRACCDSSGEIQIVDNESNTTVLTLRGHSARAHSVAFSRGGLLIASGSEDKTVKIWDAMTGGEISTLQGHNDAVHSVAFSRNGLFVASGSEDKTIKIWDIKSSPEFSTTQSHCIHSDPVDLHVVALTVDDNRIASASRDGIVKIWAAETGENIQSIHYGQENEFWKVLLSPDGRYVAVWTFDRTLVISDANSGATISTHRNFDFGPSEEAVSLGSRYVAASKENTILVNDIESGQDAVVLRGHRDHEDIMCLSFSPKDHHIIASASTDRTIKIWNVVIGAEISSLNVGACLSRLKFDSTGACLYTDSPLSFHDFTWSASLSHTELVLPKLKQSGYLVRNSWITWRGQNVLWLPHEFRASENDYGQPWDALPHMISIVCPSGLVWWIKFSSQHHPFAL